MQPRYRASSIAHVVRIAATMVVLVILGIGFRQFLMPVEFGKHGHYRPGAVDDEGARAIRLMASESCFDCHPSIRKLHEAGIHKDVSCETCHGPYADHVKDEAVFATMPTVRGEDISPMCLKCHNKIIQARPPESIKMVEIPVHLEEKKVRTHHVCNQCHHVHAPLKWVHEAREMVGLPLEKEGS